MQQPNKCLHFSQIDEFEKSEKSAFNLKTLKDVSEDKADLQEVLLVQKPAKSQEEEAIKKLQEEKYGVERALKKEQAGKDRLNTKIEEKEANTGLEKKSQLCKACQKLQPKEKELSDKTLAPERSSTAEKRLRSSSKAEKKKREQSGFQKKAPHAMRGTSKSKEDLLYDMQTLKMENLNLRAKLEEMESQYNRMKSKQSVFNQPEDKLENVAEEEWFSKGKTRQKELEMALKETKTLTYELKQTVGAVKKQHDGFRDVFTKRVETLEERQKLADAAQKNQDRYSRFPEQKMEDIQLSHVSDTEHKTAPDQSTKALYNLQKAYIDLVKKNSDVNDDYRELLKTHTSLQIKYNKFEK